MRIIHGKLKLFFYGMGAMGVNMLNLVIGSYLCDALMVEGFDKNRELWTYADKTLVVAAVWSVMITIAKIVDGFIDIPLAAFSDNLKTKWGRRRPAIIMGVIPMVAMYVMFLNPPSGEEHSMLNTLWCGITLCFFYVFYTLTMGTYYATFAEIVDNDHERVTLSNYKAFFDVIYFVMGYGIIPLMISGNLNIRTIGFIFLPLVLTMLIPLFMIKEKSTLDKDRNKEADGERDTASGSEKAGTAEDPVNVGMITSLKYCFKNKGFMIWMAVYSMLQFGLQMYITGQNVYYSGTMKLEGWQMTVLTAVIFAPVPFTLILYNKIVKKKGLKRGFVFSVAAFMVAMAIVTAARPEIFADTMARMAAAVIGCLAASFGIGCFFSISYTVPSAMAERDRIEQGVSHPTMFFALQGLASGLSTSLATGIVWVNLKDHNLSWLLPVIVFISSAATIGLTFLLPKPFAKLGITEPNEKDKEK